MKVEDEVQHPSTNDQITRMEYEARHIALQTQVSQVEARLIAEQTLIKADMEKKFDRVLDSLDKLRNELVTKDSYKTQVEAHDRRIDALEKAQMSKPELFALRLSAIVALSALLLEILSKYRFIP